MADIQTNSVAPSSGVSSKKPRQGRSPAFPFIPLNKAIERAETFRIAEGGRPKHFSPLVSACKAWGIGVKTGPGIQTVAALGHYGLFEFQGSGEQRSARLTDLAFRILLDKQPLSPERDELIRRAALMPRIHAELWKNWPKGLASDSTIETYLVRDRGFSESGARALIVQYKETITFAKLGQPAIISPEQDDETDGVVENEQGPKGTEPPERVNPPERRLPPLVRRPPVMAGSKQDVFSLPEGEVVLQWPEPLSPESYEDFESWLNLVLRKVKRSVREPRKSPSDPPAEATQADQPASHVSFMITQEQKTALRERGYNDAQIHDMKPEDAHRALGIVN